MTAIDLPFAQHLHQLLAPLTEPLHEAFALAHAETAKHMPPYKNAGRMAHIQSGLIRAGVREHLSVSDLGKWRLGGDPNLMGQLSIHHPEEHIQLRVLKSAKSTGVPHAGTNPTRRAFWRNTPMLEMEQLEFPLPASHNLLMLWAPSSEGAYDLKVARPLIAGKFRGRITTDFMMDLAPTRTLFETLEFPGEDYEDEDLFRADIEEGEDGSGAG